MKRHRLALLALVLVALVLRVYRLDAVSLRGDEAFTVVFVQRTWEGLWKGISTIEPNPPLMYLLLRVWIAVAGASEWATRYFSVFFGVLCVPLVDRLAREMFRKMRNARTIGLIAAVLVAFNPYQIWHSQDVRNYTLWPALSLVALVFFWKWWNGENSKLEFAILFYVLATTASLYTHYYDTFILVAENIFVFALALGGRRWRTLARWVGAQVVIAAAYVPWVLFGTNRITTYGEASAQQSVPLLDQFSRTLATLVLGDTVPETLKTLLWLPLAIVLVAILVRLAWRPEGRARAFFLTLYIAVPTLALYAISIGRPLFLERYLNGIAPGYYLVFAVGLAGIRNSKFVIRNSKFVAGISNFEFRVSNSVFAACLLPFLATSAYALSNYYFDPAYAKAPDWRGLTQFIAARQQPGDVIVQNFTEMAAIYYLDGKLPVVTVPKSFWPTAEDDRSLEQLERDYTRIWFIPSSGESWDPVHFVERYLSRHDERVMDTEVAAFRLQLYATPRQFESRITHTDARVGNANLVGYDLPNLDAGGSSVRKGSVLRISLFWEPIQKTSLDLTVFVHIVDSGGRVVAQQDSKPVGGTWPTPEWLPGQRVVDTYDVPMDVPPGEYALSAGMYDPMTLVRVPATSARGKQLTDNSVPLTQITVTP